MKTRTFQLLLVFILLAPASLSIFSGCGHTQQYASLQDFMEDNKSGGPDYTKSDILAYVEAVHIIQNANKLAMNSIGISTGPLEPKLLLRIPGFCFPCLIDNSLSNDKIRVKIYRPDLDITEWHNVGPGTAKEISLPVGEYQITRYDINNSGYKETIQINSSFSDGSDVQPGSKLLKLKENSLTELEPMFTLGQNWNKNYCCIIPGWNQKQ